MAVRRENSNQRRGYYRNNHQDAACTKAPQNFRNLFLAKLPEHLRFDDMAVILKAVLVTLGPKGADAIPAPESTMVSLDPTTGVSKRFGFALFSSDSDGRRAQAVLNGAEVSYDATQKRVLSVTAHPEAHPTSPGATHFRLIATGSKFDGATAAAESPCLYVRNIPNTCTTEEITTLLSRYGPLAFCAVRGDHLQRPVWVVFAEYKDTDSARRALNALHGNRELFPSSGTAVMAKYADTQEQREQRRNVRSFEGDGFVHSHAPKPHLRDSFGHSTSSDHLDHDGPSTPHHRPLAGCSLGGSITGAVHSVPAYPQTPDHHSNRNEHHSQCPPSPDAHIVYRHDPYNSSTSSVIVSFRASHAANGGERSTTPSTPNEDVSPLHMNDDHMHKAFEGLPLAAPHHDGGHVLRPIRALGIEWEPLVALH